MKGDFEVGKLALVVGARTEHGRRYIGRVLTLAKHLPKGILVTHKGEIFLTQQSDAWIVEGSDILSPNGFAGICAFQTNHLLLLDDPDEEIKQEDKTKELEAS